MVMVVMVINSVLWSFAPKPQPRQLVETKCWASLFLATVLGLCCSECAAPPQVALFGLATAALLKRIHHSDSIKVPSADACLIRQAIAWMALWMAL
jgi:hypothetical protein